MPHPEPRPDWLFNWLDAEAGIPRQLAEGLNTRVFVGRRIMVSVVRIAPHTHGRIHCHPEEQWGVLMEGEAVRIQNEEEIPVKKGDFWWTPGNMPHGMRTSELAAIVLDIFSPPRPEYRKPGTGYGESRGE